jgi:hypothetical protein
LQLTLCDALNEDEWDSGKTEPLTMSDQTTKIEATLFDSCVRVRIQIDPELVLELRDGAEFALGQIKAQQLAGQQPKPADIILQASKDKSKTIKPTLTFEDKDGTGMTGVVILQVENSTPKKA